MSGFKIQLDGLDEVLKQLDMSQIRKEVKLELQTFGRNVEKSAKDLAPVNEGFLKNQIYHTVTDEGNKINVEVGCNADYAAYVEFGTRKFAAAYVATLPPDWRAFAAQYKGKGSGGSFNDFVMAIMAWVERKGIGSLKTKSGNKSKSAASYDAMQQAAYWIALNIIRNGIKPHPFLYPAVDINRKLLLDRLESVLNDK
jgi:HK97 gp10 family phage protein